MPGAVPGIDRLVVKADRGSPLACAVDFSIAFRCDPNVLNCPASKHPAEVPLALHLFWIRPMTDEIDFPTAYEPAKQVSFLT